MPEKNYLHIAYRISRECCDWMHQFPEHIFKMFEQQTHIPSEFEKINLLSLIHKEKEADIPFVIFGAAKHVIELNKLQGIPFKEFSVYNKDIYTLEPNADSQPYRVQTDKIDSHHRDSEQTIRHNFTSVTIIETETERFKGPVFETRLWPVDVTRTFREIEDIKDRHHPTRLLSLVYGFIRDFNYHTNNYQHFFEKGSGYANVDLLKRTTDVNGQILDYQYHMPMSKMYKHAFNDHSTTREWFERKMELNMYTPEGYRPIIIDDIEEASLKVTCHTEVVETPKEEKTVIHHQTDKADEGQQNDKSIEQTLTMTGKIITDKYKLVIPFTQIRRWPQACEGAENPQKTKGPLE